MRTTGSYIQRGRELRPHQVRFGVSVAFWTCPRIATGRARSVQGNCKDRRQSAIPVMRGLSARFVHTVGALSASALLGSAAWRPGPRAAGRRSDRQVSYQQSHPAHNEASGRAGTGRRPARVRKAITARDEGCAGHAARASPWPDHSTKRPPDHHAGAEDMPCALPQPVVERPFAVRAAAQTPEVFCRTAAQQGKCLSRRSRSERIAQRGLARRRSS